VESFCQLTALQHLGLTVIENVLSDANRLVMLGQLTSLQLAYADSADWLIFEGCAGLRALHLGGASCLLHAAWGWVLRMQPAPCPDHACCLIAVWSCPHALLACRV
jgi:hypothetical protein